MTAKQLTETQETIAVAQWLKRRKIFFCHVPNEGHRGSREGSILKAMGTRKGIPDLLIFSTIPEPFATPDGPRGYAIEMKRAADAAKPPAGATPAQLYCLEQLRDAGWEAAVCYGAAEAIAQLVAWGFPEESAL